MLCFSDNLQIDLLPFKKLKEIHYYHRELERDRNPEEHRANVDRILTWLVERKVRLRRNLEVYRDGIRRQTEAVGSFFQLIPNGSLELSMEELASILRDFDEPELAIPLVIKSKFHPDHLILDSKRNRKTDDLTEHLARSIRHLILPDMLSHEIMRRMLFVRPPEVMPPIPMPGTRTALFDSRSIPAQSVFLAM